MDKQIDKDINVRSKMIEELTNDLAKVLYGEEYSDILNVAYFLDEQGYRKIPENAVVLTRSHEDKIFNDYVEYIKKVRKETVERYAERLKEKLQKFFIDNEDNDGKISKGVFILDVIGVESIDGEVISWGLIDDITKEILEE